MTVVLDATVLLAYLLQEPGAEVVDGLLNDARMTSVNWAEVVQKAHSAGVDVQGMMEELQALGLQVEPFWLQTASAQVSCGPLLASRDYRWAIAPASALGCG